MEENQVTNEDFIEEGSEDYEFIEKAQNVRIRTGDDQITVKSQEPDDYEEENVQEETFEENETPEQEIPELEETEELATIEKQLEDNRNGFDDMTSKALESGKMVQSDIEIMMKEYEEHGELSESTLAKLEEAGYPKSFVRSYIQGQEALATRYAHEIYNYAGGKESFDRYVNHLGEVSPESLELLQEAVTGGNLKTVKGILNLARDSMVSKFGKQQQRTVTNVAKQTVAPKADVFESKREMMDAMSDPRYCRDAAYTNSVDAKLLRSNLF